MRWVLKPSSIKRLLVHMGGRYNIRTFLEEDMEIPIYEIPGQHRVRACLAKSQRLSI